MSDISVKKDYLNKIKLIKKYNKFYYDKSNPAISDDEYDKIKRDLIIKFNNNEKLNFYR